MVGLEVKGSHLAVRGLWWYDVSGVVSANVSELPSGKGFQWLIHCDILQDQSKTATFAVFVKMGNYWSLSCLSHDLEDAIRDFWVQVREYKRESRIVNYAVIDARAIGNEVVYGNFEVASDLART